MNPDRSASSEALQLLADALDEGPLALDALQREVRRDSPCEVWLLEAWRASEDPGVMLEVLAHADESALGHALVRLVRTAATQMNSPSAAAQTILDTLERWQNEEVTSDVLRSMMELHGPEVLTGVTEAVPGLVQATARAAHVLLRLSEGEPVPVIAPDAAEIASDIVESLVLHATTDVHAVESVRFSLATSLKTWRLAQDDEIRASRYLQATAIGRPVMERFWEAREGVAQRVRAELAEILRSVVKSVPWPEIRNDLSPQEAL